jgi:hypothetical protein
LFLIAKDLSNKENGCNILCLSLKHAVDNRFDFIVNVVGEGQAFEGWFPSKILQNHPIPLETYSCAHTSKIRTINQVEKEPR